MKVQRWILAVLAVLTLTSALWAQGRASPFDVANEHIHMKPVAIEGAWGGRSRVETRQKMPYMLGNAFTVRLDDKMEQIFYRVFTENDGPMIAMLESKTGTRVRVTYDPKCLYAVKLEQVTPDRPRNVNHQSVLRQ